MIRERDESIEFINEESTYREKAVEVDRTTMSVPEMGEQSYSVRDMAELLQISKTTVYDIINRNHLETIVMDFWKRIPRDVFER